MATTKKSAGTKKKTTVPPRKTVAAKASGAQVFDIIPRSQVKPQATSRPVITTNQPEVADNTLKQPASAPVLQLGKHKMIAVTPSSDAVAATIEPAKAESEAASATSAPAGAEAKAPSEKGVSVAELIAKRSEKEGTTDVESDTVAAPAAPADAVEPPKETASDEVVAEAQPASEAAAETSGVVSADDSIENALKDDSSKPQEHSQALKDAMKDMDGESDGRPHYELYGGKPVIVVHKDHGAKSALLWMLWFFICLGLALLIVDLLLDAKLITTTYNVPHTNFF